MNSQQQIQTDIESSTIALEEALASCANDLFNSRPANGGWTAAQILEHLWLIERSVNKQLAGVANATEREVDKKVEIIKTLFEDNSKQYDSPTVFVPTDGWKNKTELVEKLNAERKQLAALASQLDLTETCLAFKHPYLGAFTRYEWIYFIVIHSNRHLIQLKKTLGQVQSDVPF